MYLARYAKVIWKWRLNFTEPLLVKTLLMIGLKIFEKCIRVPRFLLVLIVLKLGNFGDCKAIGDGIAELRIHYGPGIRVYYSKIGNKVILLLCGGDKGSQTKDINKAKEYLKEYQSREKNYGKK